MQGSKDTNAQGNESAFRKPQVRCVMSQPLIVLHVVGRMDIGGAESRIMDLYRHIDREKIQFYFMQHTSHKCAFEDEVASLGGKVYHVPRFRVTNYFSYRKAWKEFLKEHPEIQVVHGHMTSTAAIYLPIAKKAGVQTTIAHARSAGVDPGLKGYVTRFLRRNLYRKCDYRFTCSGLAAEAVFGSQKKKNRKAYFIPNAIEVDKFKFKKEIREKLRQSLGIEKAFVIGHVGRFSPMKNHEYMLQILIQCMKMEKEKMLSPMVLMFLGDGELKKPIMEKAKEMGIMERVLFLGNQKDVYRYYQAMDFFLLPSFYEGLPGTAIEAQAAGLCGILSDAVTKEAVVTDLLELRSIKEKASVWAEKIVKENQRRTQMIQEQGREKAEELLLQRGSYAELVKQASFDVKEQAKRMQEFYLTGIDGALSDERRESRFSLEKSKGQREIS